MKAQPYYYQEPNLRDCKDPVKLAELRRVQSMSLERMTQLARIGVALIAARRMAGVDSVTGDFA